MFPFLLTPSLVPFSHHTTSVLAVSDRGGVSHAFFRSPNRKRIR